MLAAVYDAKESSPWFTLQYVSRASDAQRRILEDTAEKDLKGAVAAQQQILALKVVAAGCPRRSSNLRVPPVPARLWTISHVAMDASLFDEQLYPC